MTGGDGTSAVNKENFESTEFKRWDKKSFSWKVEVQV